MTIINDDLQLNMYESGGVAFPFQIRSGGLGPCIAIGISDFVKRLGYMLHQPNAYHDNEVENFIREVLLRSKISNLQLYICGGAIDVNEESEVVKSILDSRNFVESIAAKYFKPLQITINWSQSDVVSELILDTSSGKFEVETSTY